MKGMIWNCEFVSWNYPSVHKHLDDCLLLFICFEDADTDKELSETTRRIEQLNEKRYRRESIIIFPYAHLSSNIMPLQDALSVFESLLECLRKNFKNVEALPFNKEKNVVIDLLPKAEDVTFFEY